MKKYLLLFLITLMFIPFIVKAETCDTSKITISSITLQNKSQNVNELSEATASGKNNNLDLSMSNVGDNIEYKILVKNDSNDDYELNNSSFNVSSNYIDYSIHTDDNSNIVKANSTKLVHLKVKYANQVPDDKFEEGSFSENKSMVVNLSTNSIENPKTGIINYTLVLTLVLIASVVLEIMLRKKNFSTLIILIGIALIIPISIDALCKCELNINSKVQIEKSYFCYNNKQFEFTEGMTWEEYYYSDYFKEEDWIHVEEDDNFIWYDFPNVFIYNNGIQNGLQYNDIEKFNRDGPVGILISNKKGCYDRVLR